MQAGTFEQTMYIVQYTRADRAEGGPIETRHFVDTMSALQHADYIKTDPAVSNIQVWKQESKIKRSRIH